MILLAGNDISVRWSITKDNRSSLEDFDDAEVCLILVSPGKKTKLKISAIEDNIVCADIAGNTLTPAVYHLDLIWSKNQGKNWARVKEKNSFIITDNPDEVDVDCDRKNHHLVEIGSVAVSIGYDGLSAYDIAVKNGYTGTEEEWLYEIRLAQTEKIEAELHEIYGDLKGDVDTLNGIVRSVSITDNLTDELEKLTSQGIYHITYKEKSSMILFVTHTTVNGVLRIGQLLMTQFRLASGKLVTISADAAKHRIYSRSRMSTDAAFGDWDTIAYASDVAIAKTEMEAYTKTTEFAEKVAAIISPSIAVDAYIIYHLYEDIEDNDAYIKTVKATVPTGATLEVDVSDYNWFGWEGNMKIEDEAGMIVSDDLIMDVAGVSVIETRGMSSIYISNKTN